MSTNKAQIEALYELSLAISPCDTLEATASQALDAYLDALDCDAGAILERVEGEAETTRYRTVVTVPDRPEQRNSLRTALGRLPADGDEQFRASLPVVGTTSEGAFALLELPGFGVLVLCGTLDAELRSALGPLNEKLAEVCLHSRSKTAAEDELARKTGSASRQQTLERLYEEAMEILPETDRERVAEQSVVAATEIVDVALAGIHLYNRATEALDPVAVINRTDRGLEEIPDPYTDHETVVWEVYRTGEPVVIDDVDRFDGVLPKEDTPVGSAVVLPLGDHGVFIASSLETHAFDPTEVEILRLFSTLVEIALDRSKREQGLAGIQEITRTALTADSHEEVAEVAMQRVPELLDLPLSAVWRYDATADALRPIAWTGKAEELFGEIPTFGDESLAWRAFQDNETYVVRDAQQSEKVYNEDTVIGSEIAVPLGDFGVLVTGSTRVESFADPERRLVATLAANLETALRLIDHRQALDLLDQVLARILRHNIRNDLNIIQGYASQITDRGDDETVSLAEKIIQRCHDLESTAEHAREMRQIVRSREQRASVALQKITEDAVSLVQLEQPGAEITATYRASPEVVAHPDLTTAIRHLLENSIKHHDESPGSAVVEVTVDETPEHAVLTVEDNGPGIPRSEIEILDQHGESALEHGSGAGLWIIDRVIQYSGATIEYERTDSGTLVTIRFELAD